jgi:hypothetical protein
MISRVQKNRDKHPINQNSILRKSVDDCDGSSSLRLLVLPQQYSSEAFWLAALNFSKSYMI